MGEGNSLKVFQKILSVGVEQFAQFRRKTFPFGRVGSYLRTLVAPIFIPNSSATLRTTVVGVSYWATARTMNRLTTGCSS